ncbi:MCE family protein (plasmid) [Azospirillum oryzae]|uniref:MCE family protein n=1 Tax=Azospirillum oryzae TaxID=286727 RepID=A0A6N1AJH4_9PROT|nr:MlaD family protein [Azospirillum oryzae]KAA0588342.1 MCE family protein [Azospirillum oryzae]QKS49384.1 MCE family protein [Azospirillum oryzae]GLR78304.1 paraquat-inducible protein [Azospirillum oryzae]
MADETPNDHPPEVATPSRRRLSPLWILPLVAVLIAGWLGWRWFEERGPQIVITFQSGDGLEAGRTRIKHKNVDLGVIESVRLSDDLSQVIATARMDRTATRHLKEGTRFWMVAPRLSLGGVSGLSTVVSGTYVEMEPGGGDDRREFDALDEPPVIRADVPGRSFNLKTEQLGSLAQGSPVYFRGVQIGEVMGYNLSPQDRTVSVSVFVRAPYEKLVHEGSRFWRSSGIQFSAGADGIKFQTESLKSLALGGVVLETPADPEAGAQANDWATFTLYEDQASAAAARDRLRVRYRLEFPGSVQGLQAGAPVLMRGLTVGHVAAVRLEYDENRQVLHIPVDIDIEPDLVARTYAVIDGKPMDEAAVRKLVATQVAKGLRGRLASGNLLTGQKLVSFDYEPGNPPTAPGTERSELPTVASSDLESLTRSAGQVMDKVAALPLDALLADLRGTLQSISGVAGSPDLARSLAALAKALGSADALMRDADRQLPQLVKSLRGVATAAQGTLNSANGLLGGGGGQADLPGVMRQLNDAARSFRVLADYLERHPEALLRGKR